MEPVVQRFAHLLHQEVGAERVLLFGSRARADTFSGIESARRGVGLWELWYRAGGNAPLDLICVTPDEFALARARISLIAEVLPQAVDVLAGRWAADEKPDEVPAR